MQKCKLPFYLFVFLLRLDPSLIRVQCVNYQNKIRYLSSCLFSKRLKDSLVHRVCSLELDESFLIQYLPIFAVFI